MDHFYIVATVWYIIGVVGVIHWHTLIGDFKTSSIIPAMILATLGPVNFLIYVGFRLHTADKVIFKQKKY